MNNMRRVQIIQCAPIFYELDIYTAWNSSYRFDHGDDIYDGDIITSST